MFHIFQNGGSKYLHILKNKYLYKFRGKLLLLYKSSTFPSSYDTIKNKMLFAGLNS